MNPRNLPGISYVLDYGPENRVYDALLILGPPLILLAAITDAITAVDAAIVVEAFAVGYLAVFVGYVIYRGTQ